MNTQEFLNKQEEKDYSVKTTMVAIYYNNCFKFLANTQEDAEIKIIMLDSNARNNPNWKCVIVDCFNA